MALAERLARSPTSPPSMESPPTRIRVAAADRAAVPAPADPVPLAEDPVEALAPGVRAAVSVKAPATRPPDPTAPAAFIRRPATKAPIRRAAGPAARIVVTTRAN